MSITVSSPVSITGQQRSCIAWWVHLCWRFWRTKVCGLKDRCWRGVLLIWHALEHMFTAAALLSLLLSPPCPCCLMGAPVLFIWEEVDRSPMLIDRLRGSGMIDLSLALRSPRAIGCFRPSACLSFRSSFWTHWSLTFIFVESVGHDHGHGIKIQGHRSRSKVMVNLLMCVFRWKWKIEEAMAMLTGF